MTTIISNTSLSVVPTMVLGWNSEQPSTTQIHPIIGSEVPDVTTRPALKRSGTLNLLFDTELGAYECRIMLTEAGIFALSTTDLDHVDMQFVVSGTVKVELDATLTRWIVNVAYQEV